MEDAPPVTDAKKPPVRRKTPLALVLMIALSFSAVLGTVLLSKDMQHLRRLAALLGVTIAPPKPEPVAKHIPFGPPRPIRKITLNPRLAVPADTSLATALRRTWQMDGPDMCKALRSAGIEPSAWQPAAFGGDVFECSYEKVYRKEKNRIVSSLFVIVRGNASGVINSLRVKLVAPARDPQGNLDPAIVKLFETMLTQSRWGDFSAELEAIRTLKDVKKQGFGASLRFAREFDSPDDYNFMLTLEALSPEQRRLNPFFSREAWFSAPKEPAAPPLDPSGASLTGGDWSAGQTVPGMPPAPVIGPDGIATGVQPAIGVPQNAMPLSPGGLTPETRADTHSAETPGASSTQQNAATAPSTGQDALPDAWRTPGDPLLKPDPAQTPLPGPSVGAPIDTGNAPAAIRKPARNQGPRTRSRPQDGGDQQ